MSKKKKNNENENTENTLLARADEFLPTSIHLLPIAARPFFPGQAVPLLVDEEFWNDTIAAVAETPHKMIGLVLSDADMSEESKPDELRSIGTVGRIHRAESVDGSLQVLVECIKRFNIVRLLTSEAPFMAEVEYLKEHKGQANEDVKSYALAIINTIKELLPLNPLYAEELRMFLDRFGPDDPEHLADFAASLTASEPRELQEILETRSLLPRMKKVMNLLHKELQLAKTQHRIRESVEKRMDKNQREFFLREQLKSIQSELGIEKDDRTAELDTFRERIESLQLTEQASKRLDEEMNKLSILEVGSPEYALTRNYIDWITLLPWGKESADHLDLDLARKTLDKDHYGLDEVKERIIEFLAVGIMKGEINGSIILLIGPPGVGKTSIGKSIAEALGRSFYRLSVGGIRDEAEIKGHRRTYIGAMPGKFIQAMKEVETSNPVIMLDEIDKIGASYQGDPASALLEVLDPEQNSDFLDHYLDLRFDLSKALFICTANQLDTIPGPLLDRMETIPLSGYIAEEKLQIARKYLVPRQLKRAGIKRNQLKIGTPALRAIIDGYARDAGVRRLEKQIGKIVRKAAVKILGKAKTPITVNRENIETWLGSKFFTDERKLQGIGIVTGLAWTSMGGATLSIEAVHTHSFNRGLKLTGQLGDVMQESAEIAYGYIVSHAHEYPIEEDFFSNAFIHLHVPAGATPKDGPSAGITMATALLSLALGKKPARNIAMTGELTLTGQVFPVGGIREKVIAARRSGIRELILPIDNQGDYEEIPEHIRKGIKVHFAENYTDVAAILFPMRKKHH
ncbi:endopeptidase La [Solemya velum gill symbiont]|uniref:endopeptidase La n=1 Tax=Solemya velum gill symbiont TaxID=2340 RepID=UPI000996AB03|nr:endopeptidase La [Solemya velum gill symbiont]OOZ62441.1 endopeptidase La [Solemya velum gill symbiont]